MGMLGLSILGTGCIGFHLPEFMKMPPLNLLRGGGQLGRDQLANRFLIAQYSRPIKGLESNQILSYLGQPQEIEVREKDVSEDWYFIYYKKYKTRPRTDKGIFIVHMYHNKVIDVTVPN